jgi:hypothetical protein
MRVNGYLVHLEEMLEHARRLRREMERGDERAGWYLVLLVRHWAQTRSRMLREPYDENVSARVSELSRAFVRILKGEAETREE